MRPGWIFLKNCWIETWTMLLVLYSHSLSSRQENNLNTLGVCVRCKFMIFSMFIFVLVFIQTIYIYIYIYIREYRKYREVTTSRLKSPRHLVVHDNLKTFTQPKELASVQCTLRPALSDIVQFNVIMYHRNIRDQRRQVVRDLYTK